MLGARVDTSSLYPEFPVAVVLKMCKGTCTLFYPGDSKYESRELKWVRKNLTVYPREEAYDFVMYDSASKRWLVRDGASRRTVYHIPRDVLEGDLAEWILTCASASPSFWLPVETRRFCALQAKGAEWEAFLPGGFGIPLPENYVRQCFSKALILKCQNSPEPEDCTRVGAAATSARREGAPPSATVVGGPPAPSSSAGGGACDVGSALTSPSVGGSRFSGCAEDYCLTLGVAGALDRAGDAEAADIVAGFAASSLAQPAGTNRVKWLKNECAQKLQRLGWTTGRVPNAQQLTKADVLAATQRGVASVYQVVDSSGFLDHAFATVVSPDGRRWLHDMNHGYVPLSAKGLDTCCVGEGTCFKGVISAFTLTRSEGAIEPKAKRQHVGIE